jgi:hypothetical protein
VSAYSATGLTMVEEVEVAEPTDVSAPGAIVTGGQHEEDGR